MKKLCVPFTAGLTRELERIGDLTIYAWRFRYPGAPYTPEREEAEQAMKMASELLDAIVSQLETEFNRS